MSIQFDPSRLSASVAQTAVDASSAARPPARLASLLGGSAVTVTDGRITDLEALVARIRNESEKTKLSLLVSSLAAVRDSLTVAQQQELDAGLALVEKLDALDASLLSLEASYASDKAAAAALQVQIDSLERQIEQAQQDGVEHNELVEEQKALRVELEAKEAAMADAQTRIGETKNEIASVHGEISALVKSIGMNTLKTIADELGTMGDAEKAERPAEAEKKGRKAADNPFAAIRDALDRIARDLTETIVENRIENV